MPDLSKVAEREMLKCRREPHWHRLRPGCFLGYRPSAKGGAGTWIARAYDQETRTYRLKALGSFGEVPSRERFVSAKRASEAFTTLVEGGSNTDAKIETVEQACREFAAGQPEAAARFRRYVYSDPLAKVKLEKLRKSHVAAWRKRMAETPALISRAKGIEPRTRERSPATLNRDMAPLRTALGRVLALGTPNTEAAWQEPLRPVKNAVNRRTTYLGLNQRRALLQAVTQEAEPFVRALCLLPLRPGAMAALNVSDFDKRTNELTIGKDKAGHGRRIVVAQGAALLIAEASKDKLPAAALFTRSNGRRWDRNTWNDPISIAAAAAGLEGSITTYTLRHSTITDLICSGLPLLTVAQISGTSAEMIERHYGHLVRDAATHALATLAL